MRKSDHENQNNTGSVETVLTVGKTMPLTMEERIHTLREQLGDSPDLVFRDFASRFGEQKGILVFFRTLVDDRVINSQIIEHIQTSSLREPPHLPVADAMDLIENVIMVSGIKRMLTVGQAVKAILLGNTVLFLEGCLTFLAISTPGWQSRGIDEPAVENEVRGSRESFTENLSINIGMIRRRVNDGKLRFIESTLGTTAHTRVWLGYIEGAAEPSLLDDVIKRVSSIEVDGVIDTNYIEEWIKDHPLSLFPQVDITERPERVVAMLLEGRIAILVDGVPNVLIVPVIFWQLLTTAGDYSSNFYFGTILRWLRLLAFITSLTLPSLYIAITTMHQEMIPTPLALSIAAQRSGVPFPAIMEALIMEVAFELLREAGIRLPKVAGQAISIVGGLIIGEAAVNAGLVSPLMVVVVSVTGISSFAVPSYFLSGALRTLRFILMFAASILGIPGISLLLICILTYMVSMKSFGVPYLSPLAPTNVEDWKDTVIRSPYLSIRNNKHKFAKRHTGSISSEFDLGEN